jgi:ribonuclease HII
MGVDVGEELVCGVDEAGRGPLAGPVTAAAVILSKDFPCEILADSKALSPSKRERAARVIRSRAIEWSAGWAWPEEIDRINIHHATLLAMQRAVQWLTIRPDLVLVDGLFTPKVGIRTSAIVRGDTSVPQIMAASIIAKTLRDAWMKRYAEIEPGYGFERHKGYPTVEHRKKIHELGPSAIHRRSFRLISS